MSKRNNNSFSNRGKNPDCNTILCISDEPVFLKSMANALTSEGYTIQCHYDPRAALDFIAAHSVDIVICDYRLRSIDGVALLCQVKQQWPETIRILYGSVADLEFIEDDFSQAGLYRFLQKPFDMNELMMTLEYGFAFHDLILENRRLSSKIKEMAAYKGI